MCAFFVCVCVPKNNLLVTVPVEINFLVRGKIVNIYIYCFSLVTVNNVGTCFLELMGMYCIYFAFNYKRKTVCRDG